MVGDSFAGGMCHHSTTDAMEESMDSEKVLSDAAPDLDPSAQLPLHIEGKEDVAAGGGQEEEEKEEEKPPISKNQQKKQAKLQLRAETRDQWKNEKRDKKRAAKERKRQAQKDSDTGLKRKADGAEEQGDEVGSADGSVEGGVEEPTKKKQKIQPKRVLEPITLIMDCGFDEKMNDKVCVCVCVLFCAVYLWWLTCAAGNHLHVFSAHTLLRRQPSVDAPGLPPRHFPQRPAPRALSDSNQQPAPALEGRPVLRHGLRGHRREQGQPGLPDRGLAGHGRGPGARQELHHWGNRRQESAQGKAGWQARITPLSGTPR